MCSKADIAAAAKVRKTSVALIGQPLSKDWDGFRELLDRHCCGPIINPAAINARRLSAYLGFMDLTPFGVFTQEGIVISHIVDGFSTKTLREYEK